MIRLYPTKPCRKCGGVRFYVRKGSKGLGTRQCAGVCNRPTAEARRRHRIKVSFGITPEQYDKMLWGQSGQCAVCKNPETLTVRGRARRLAIDHDHDTGCVRGLLCSKCNTALGLLQDDQTTIDSLSKYHKKHANRPCVAVAGEVI